MNEVSNGLAVVSSQEHLEVEEPLPSALVGSKAWAIRTRRRARELVHTLDIGYMELARILYEVYDTPIDGDPHRGPIYTLWGYETFGDYAEKELGIQVKKAERLRRIWFIMEKELGGLSPELKQRAVNLGYSKVRELLRVFTEGDPNLVQIAEKWIPYAEKQSYRQLLSSISEEQRLRGIHDAESAVLGIGGVSSSEANGDAASAVNTGMSMEKLTREDFNLFPEQLLNVRRALQKAAEMLNSEKRGHQLDMICTDFLATNDFMGSDTDKRLRYVAKLERILGLKLVAIDPEAEEVVYGFRSLEQVAEALRKQETEH